MAKGKCKTRKRRTVSAKTADLSGITSRVRQVGPEHFGLVAVDSSKKTYSKKDSR